MKRTLSTALFCLVFLGMFNASAKTATLQQNEEILKCSERIDAILAGLDDLDEMLSQMDTYRGKWKKCPDTDNWLGSTESLICNSDEKFHNEFVQIQNRLKFLQTNGASSIPQERAQTLLGRISRNPKLQAILGNKYCQYAHRLKTDFYQPSPTAKIALSH